MLKSFKGRIPRIMCLVLCVAVIIAVPLLQPQKSSANLSSDKILLNIWQIDSFEGGKGSRADYLQSVADDGKNYYVNVTSLSAAAARENLKNGNLPDLISYGAGTYGLESYINSYKIWCMGGYCLLTITDGADFSDVTVENTVINGGIDNLSDVAAVFCGIGGAISDRPTGAYVKLLGGKYKYLLGTQRDIFRLRTRGVSYKVKAVTQFNDLYQNISVVTKEKNKINRAEEFISALSDSYDNVKKLGLMCENARLYEDNLDGLENIEYQFKLNSPISESLKIQIQKAAADNDLNLLKKLLK